MPLWTHHGLAWQRVCLATLPTGTPPPHAFLCCPGPSLALVDRDLRGPGRFILALNTAYPRIRPDAWLGMDRVACFDRRLWHEPFPKICRWVPGDTADMRHHPQVCYADLDGVGPHGHTEGIDEAEIFLRRGNDIRFVWQRQSLLVALHYLIWRGHRLIHLVGCDLSSSTGVPPVAPPASRDYHDARVLTPEQRANNQRLYASQLQMLQRLAPLARAQGIELTSATPGSPLNTFLRYVPLDAAIAYAEHRLPAPGQILHVMDAERAAMNDPNTDDGDMVPEGLAGIELRRSRPQEQPGGFPLSGSQLPLQRPTPTNDKHAASAHDIERGDQGNNMQICEVCGEPKPGQILTRIGSVNACSACL